MDDLITEGYIDEGRRFLVYGESGIGKTSFALTFPNPFFIDIENGLPPHITMPRVRDVTDMKKVYAGIAWLCNQKHEFKTLVIDSLDRMEPLLQALVASRIQPNAKVPADISGQHRFAIWPNIDDEWKTFVKACNFLRKNKKMDIIYICHGQYVEINDPDDGMYHKKGLLLRTKNSDFIQGEVDAILLLDQDKTFKETDVGFGKKTKSGVGDSSVRWLRSSISPARAGKNRLNIPDRIRCPHGQGYNLICQYFRNNIPAQNQPTAQYNHAGEQLGAEMDAGIENEEITDIISVQ